MENVEKFAKDLNEKIDGFKSQLENAVSKEDFAKLGEDLNALKDSDTVKLVEELQEKVARLEESKEKSAKEKMTLKEELKENMDVIKGIAKGNKKEFVAKALVARSTIQNNEQAFDLPDIGQLATRRLSLAQIFPTLSISNETNHNGVIRYYDWDEATIARAADMVAEGAAFPESTASWIKRSIDIRKIGDTLPVTEEFFEDEAMFAAELGMFLETNVALKEDDQLCNGDNTGQNLRGLYTSIDAYTPVASGIDDASVYDLAVKVIEDIVVTGGSKYRPDVLIAPTSVINLMKLKKDANNNYVMPPFVTTGGRTVDGLTVIECDIAPANTLVIGDRRFGRIYQAAGYEMSSGYVGSQFTEDEMTLKVRKRLAFLIREADKGGFRKVTDVAAALTTLATP